MQVRSRDWWGRAVLKEFSDGERRENSRRSLKKEKNYCDNGENHLQMPVTVVLCATKRPANPQFSGVYMSKTMSPKLDGYKHIPLIFGTFGKSNQKLIT